MNIFTSKTIYLILDNKFSKYLILKETNNQKTYWKMTYFLRYDSTQTLK